MLRRLRPLLAAALLACSACTPAPDKAALAREVILAIDGEKMLGEMIPQLEQMNSLTMRQVAVQHGFTMDESAQLAKVEPQTTALSTEAIHGLVPEMTKIYVEIYSVEELQAMKAFYTSAEGRSMLAKQPTLKQKLSPKIQDAVLAVQPRIQQLLEKEATRIGAARTAKAG